MLDTIPNSSRLVAVPIYHFWFRTTHQFLTDTTKTGVIKGVIASAQVYVAYNGGLPYQGSLWWVIWGEDRSRYR